MTTADRPEIRFASDFTLASLPRQTLADLGREWLMHGHLQDRIGSPLALTGRTREAMEQIAIDEWMATSPVYSRRSQRAFGFEGDGVDTIMKNLQFDIGAPHQFLDFRCTVRDHDHGEFHLAHCGALVDVEPMGEEFVHGMCHTIEDPTFDATAVATNPRAQVRPIHRPPRVPADRHPHCAWTITIDPSFPPVSAHPNLELVARSVAAQVVVDDPGPGTESGGWDDYSGPHDPDFELEDLSQRALVIALQEFAVQSHLLLRGFCLAVSERADGAAAAAMVARMAVGLGWTTSERLTRAFDLGTGIAAVGALVQIHPMLWPRPYTRPTIAFDGERVRVALAADAPFLAEGDDFTWLAPTASGDPATLAAIVQGHNPRARVDTVATASGEACAYEITVDASADAVREPDEASLTKISSGATFPLRRRRPVRN